MTLALARFAKGAALAALFVFCSAAVQAREAVTAKQLMVAAAHPLAAEAGRAVLRRGGSAVDAAVAVQAMLTLVEPESSGIGGGAFMLHWSERTRQLRTYDGRETAPAAARPDRFLKPGSQPMHFFEAAVGGQSVGVPGVLRMLELAHRHHGRLAWRELFDSAIAVAEEGFPLSARLHAYLDRERFLRDDPAARRLYYGADGQAKPAGSVIRNPEYAATLREIAAKGAEAFYTGEIARDIVKAVRSHPKPGDLAEQDFAEYRALERDVLCGPYRRWKVCSMAPPSSGGVAVLQILGLLERAGFEHAAPESPASLHLFSEAGKLAYADRARYLGDPDFVRIPLSTLLSPAYLQKRASLIGERAMRLAPPGDAEAGTTHFSIVDREGSAVSMTSTIESNFGSRIMVRGFLLNNQLTDFDFTPGLPNEVGPRKRPRSSMAPTLVFEENGALRLAIGSPGGSMIINFVAKALVGHLDWGLDVQSAVALPNFGSRNGPTLLERGSRYEGLRGALERRGHAVEIAPLTSGLHGIERVPGGWRGGADPRRDGVALGD